MIQKNLNNDTEESYEIVESFNVSTEHDSKGNTYHKIYYTETINVCLAIGEKNYIIPMTLNISMREGNSKYGDEIFFQLIKNGSIKDSYVKRSPKDHFEFYLQKNKGINFLDKTVIYFRKKQKE